jgi:competence protein ComEA
MSDRAWQLVACAVGGVVAVALVVGLRPGGDSAPAPVRLEQPPGSARAAGSAAPLLFVHVTGAVRRPGLYRLADGSRVARAVTRAGGPSRHADLTGVNLAARLQDGQQVVVPSRGAADPDANAGRGAPISLGTATVEQLEELDGIGPTLAERIVERRVASGGFASIDDLREVEGIGEKRLEALEQALTP